MNNKDELNIGQYSLAYNNKEMTVQLVQEIFNDNIYTFKTTKKEPLIIDAGSNIGIATIFFKSLYPQAKILCFEPDPNSFVLLKRNIFNNCLREVTIVNAALAAKTGVIDFYGEITQNTPYSCGNSIIQEWGEQRSLDDAIYLMKNKIKVSAVQLSTYITEEIDFLKLDIEGAERQVLEELGDKITLIKEIAVEIHCTNDKKFINHLDSIISLFKKYSFHTEITQKNISDIFPPQTAIWLSKAKPKLFELKAYRKSMPIKLVKCNYPTTKSICNIVNE